MYRQTSHHCAASSTVSMKTFLVLEDTASVFVSMLPTSAIGRQRERQREAPTMPMTDRDTQIAYCLEHILPIWERWTDGDPAVRRLLECESADPVQSEERFQELKATTLRLRKRGRNARIAAALA